MAEPLIACSVGVQSEGRPALFERSVEQTRAGEILVRTIYSGVSAGTELATVKGTAPKLHHGWDPDQRLFVDGAPARRYPVPVMGYMEVAEVAESRRDDVPVGQLVAMAYGHVSLHVADPTTAVVVPLPPSLDPLLGIYVAQMGPIAANGLLHAAVEEVGNATSSLADGVRDKRVVVVGAGVVGLLTALFARAGGAAEVVVADGTAQRRRAAKALGCTAVDLEALPAWPKGAWRNGPGDRGADLVFQCRGRSASLQAALASLRPQGTVIDLAFYQGPATDLLLGREFHHNGLAIRCAQIGHPPRQVSDRWDRRRLAEETVRVLNAHADTLVAAFAPVIVPVSEAPRLLADMATWRRDVIQAVIGFGEGFARSAAAARGL